MLLQTLSTWQLMQRHLTSFLTSFRCCWWYLPQQWVPSDKHKQAYLHTWSTQSAYVDIFVYVFPSIHRCEFEVVCVSRASKLICLKYSAGASNDMYIPFQCTYTHIRANILHFSETFFTALGLQVIYIHCGLLSQVIWVIFYKYEYILIVKKSLYMVTLISIYKIYSVLCA